MRSHAQSPSLPVPEHNLRSSSLYVPSVTSSQLFQQAGMMVSPRMEKHEVEGLGEQHAEGAWLSWRLGSLWPTCNRVEGNIEGSEQHHGGIESLNPGPSPHASALPYPHINSVQPTFYPSMVIAIAKPKSHAERIRGGCLPCPQGWVSSVAPQGKDPGIPINASNQNSSAQPNRPVRPENPATGPEVEGQGERPRARAHSEARHARSKAPARTPHQSGQAPEPRSRRGSQVTMTERASVPHYPIHQQAPSRALSQATVPRSSVYSDAATDPRSRVSSGAPLIRSRVASTGLPTEPPHARGRASSQFLTPAVPAMPALPPNSQKYAFPKY